MMKIRFVLALAVSLIATPIALHPQDTAKCDCQSLFGDLTEKLQQDYIGYTLRKNELGKAYADRIAEFRAHFKDTSTIACVAALQKFLTLFHDGHLFVSQSPNFSDAENERFKTTLRNQMYDPAQIRTYLVQHRTSLGDIEGVWTDGTSRFAIVRNQNTSWP
jgi:hypothetical protein